MLKSTSIRLFVLVPTLAGLFMGPAGTNLLGDELRVAQVPDRELLETQDITLGQQGQLVGQIVRPDGSPVIGSQVHVLQADQNIAAARTNSEGKFAIEGLRGGTYHITAGNVEKIARAWAFGTAPPSATNAILLVTPGQAVLGNLGSVSNGFYRLGEYKAWLAIPAAIAVGAVIQKQRQEVDRKPAS